MKRPLPLLLLTLLAVPAMAEDPAPSSVQVKPSFFVEGYQTFNITNSSLQSGEENPGLQYNSQDGLPSIGLVEAGLTASQGEGKAYVSLLLGPTAEYFFDSPLPSGLLLWEAYASYKTDDWTFTFGRRVTHMGYEAVRTDQNWNLSKSILFLSAPTLHTGLSVSCSPEEALSVTGYYYGGWDGLHDLLPRPGKALGLKIEVSPFQSLALTFSGLMGAVPSPLADPADLTGQSLFEIYAVLEAAEGLSLALHAEYGSLKDPLSGDPWPYGGAALYGRLEVAPGWAVALRLEGFLDETNMLDLYDAGTYPQLEAREATLTLERKLTENLLARLEGRFDQVFSEGVPVPAFAGDLASEQFTVTAAVMFGL